MSIRALHTFYQQIVFFLFFTTTFSFFFASHMYAAIPPGYNHSGNTVVTNIGSPQGTGGPSKGHPTTSDSCASYKSQTNSFNYLLYFAYQFNFSHNTVFSPKNFGDPICDYTKNGLASLIHQLDVQYSDPKRGIDYTKYDFCWYNVIVQHESSYDPNDEQLVDPYDPAHAWGNFQMGRGKNGKLDHGDVDWQTQVYNALTYNYTLIGANFRYWSTRRYDTVHCPQ